MRKLYIIGIGPGNPEQVTIQAIKAINQVDVFFVTSKGEAKNDLTQFRKEICERYIDEPSYRTVEIVDSGRDPTIDSYASRVEAWHQQRALTYEELIINELQENECGAFLIWGDPSLYDSTLRVIDQIISRGQIHFDYEVIPGITSIQALAARHKITLNGIGESICITTGRQLSAALISNTENVIVMLDGKCSFKEVLDKEVEIYWGAYVGSDKEVLLSGRLTETRESIEMARSAAREKNGWVMDTYLLRNPSARRP
ncbi:precorrin-6A synthase (deacetylating) [Tunturibacter empetritectus]|uniref:Precorrin-6A synthase n=1 Tax=Tunturiibacter lichenicola TaxID=2051959 RepID=A0A7W8N765_9BACT|nr:precorrin-6A synthase (deacetylating) [Edaphobacter lichenicola]MBB5345725.1 precorrin-6A synthase [Edaphobacter lichenicola]